MPSNFCVVKKSAREFTIPFVGLKIGTHPYEFNIHKAFFEGIEDSMLEDADLTIRLALEKKETMMIAQFELNGTLTTTCDRCNDPIAVPVENSYRIIFKFGNEVSDDENLIILEPEAYEIDFSSILYELMVISLPPRVIHPDGTCNPEVMKLYNTYIVNANEPEDDWDNEDDDWEEEEWDDDDPEDWDDDDWEEDQNDPDEPDDYKPIDPRWSALKNLN